MPQDKTESKESCISSNSSNASSSHNIIRQLKIEDSENNENAWKKWWQSYELYMCASGLEDATERRKVAILLHSIGDKGLEIFNSFDIDSEKISLKQLKKKYDDYFVPRKNISVVRHKFFTRQQKDNEDIDTFVTDLQNMSLQCEFEKLRESLVMDIFICNMSSRHLNIRQRLLQEPELTLEKSITLAKTMVMSQQTALKLESSVLAVSQHGQTANRRRSLSTSRDHSRPRAESTAPAWSATRSTAASTAAVRRDTRCGRCGQMHRFKCPAQGQKCRSCGKLNHFSSYCFLKRKPNVRALDSDEQMQPSKFFVGTINKDNVNESAWFLNIIVNNKNVKCMLDSGANVNVMSSQTFKSLNVSFDRIEECHANIYAYGGNAIPMQGKIALNCTFNGSQQEKITFLIARSQCPTVLGLPTCQKIGVIKRIYSVKSDVCQEVNKNKIFTEYVDVFQGLGCLPPVCRIDLRDDAVPHIDPPRKVPFALYDKLRQELDRMVEMEVIEKVTKPTQWVATHMVLGAPRSELYQKGPPRPAYPPPQLPPQQHNTHVSPPRSHMAINGVSSVAPRVPATQSSPQSPPMSSVTSSPRPFERLGAAPAWMSRDEHLTPTPTRSWWATSSRAPSGSSSQPTSLEAELSSYSPYARRRTLETSVSPPPLPARRVSVDSRWRPPPPTSGNTSPLVLQRFYHQSQQRRSRADLHATPRHRSLSREHSTGRSPEPPPRSSRHMLGQETNGSVDTTEREAVALHERLQLHERLNGGRSQSLTRAELQNGWRAEHPPPTVSPAPAPVPAASPPHSTSTKLHHDDQGWLHSLAGLVKRRLTNYVKWHHVVGTAQPLQHTRQMGRAPRWGGAESWSVPASPLPPRAPPPRPAD